MQSLDHPYICKLYEYFLNDDYYYIIYEYIEGDSLYNLIEQKIKLKQGLSEETCKIIFT